MNNSTKKSWGDTISKKGEISRVFCGNIDAKTFECEDLEKRFSKYGKVSGIDINNNGFAFIQFDRIEDAQRAVIGENKKVLKNRTLEVKMFGKSKKKRDRSRSPIANRKNHNNKPQRGNHPHQRRFNQFNNQFNDQFNDPQQQQHFQQQQMQQQQMQQQQMQQQQMSDPMLNQLSHPMNVKTSNLLSLSQQQPSPSLLGAAILERCDPKFNNAFNSLTNQNNLQTASTLALAQQQQTNAINQINQLNQLANSQVVNDYNKPPVAVGGLIGNKNSQTLANPNQAPQGNELEIIVLDKAQLQYCEMLERRFRQETCLKFIDLVFPHSPEMVAITLQDLFEKKTLYAVIVDALNEQNGTFNLHILHNQSEYSNVSINQGIQLICQDFIKEIANPESRFYNNNKATALSSNSNLPKDNFTTPYKSVAINQPSTSSGNNDNDQTQKLPKNIAYVLKTTLDDNSAEFLSIPQIDSVIEFYSSEKERLLSRNSLKKQHQSDFNSLASSSSTHLRNQQHGVQDIDVRSSQNHNNNALTSPGPGAGESCNGSNQLLDNPQIKAALNSLMNYNLGALNSGDNSHNVNTLNSNDSQLNNTNNYVSSSINSYSNNYNANASAGNYNSMSDRSQFVTQNSIQPPIIGDLSYMNNQQTFGDLPTMQGFNSANNNNNMTNNKGRQSNFYSKFNSDQQPQLGFRNTKNEFNNNNNNNPSMQYSRGPRQSRFN